jgi:hypothetical protein
MGIRRMPPPGEAVACASTLGTGHNPFLTQGPVMTPLQKDQAILTALPSVKPGPSLC